jgi:hypothetical protein
LFFHYLELRKSGTSRGDLLEGKDGAARPSGSTSMMRGFDPFFNRRKTEDEPRSDFRISDPLGLSPVKKDRNVWSCSHPPLFSKKAFFIPPK